MTSMSLPLKGSSSGLNFCRTQGHRLSVLLKSKKAVLASFDVCWREKVVWNRTTHTHLTLSHSHYLRNFGVQWTFAQLVQGWFGEFSCATNTHRVCYVIDQICTVQKLCTFFSNPNLPTEKTSDTLNARFTTEIQLCLFGLDNCISKRCKVWLWYLAKDPLPSFQPKWLVIQYGVCVFV